MNYSKIGKITYRVWEVITIGAWAIIIAIAIKWLEGFYL